MTGIAGTRGQRVYGQHGVRHSPRGSDPSATEQWRYVVNGGTAWSSGTNYSPGDFAYDSHFKYEAIHASGPSSSVGPIQPGVDAKWVAYWLVQASVFIGASNSSPSVDIPNPVPARYRLSVGAPNYVELDGSISQYAEHQFDFQGDIDVAVGDTVMWVPPEYRPQYDVPITNQHDDIGLYVPCRLKSTGEFIYGAI